ncbi:hypothetical protein BS50DRAFT_254002 [Corynespora cassiicola Philippines]|uniref:Uncharacterized protein n=1 Tax=Corynespora cassiicola Philippines TaxID=1448308 RepID=A0A2T2P4K6_CORCC|nr:hypothetical protein BS50DRAFT_254002 [Corynespora cassiicola Philippines]
MGRGTWVPKPRRAERCVGFVVAARLIFSAWAWRQQANGVLVGRVEMFKVRMGISVGAREGRGVILEVSFVLGQGQAEGARAWARAWAWAWACAWGEAYAC